MIGSEILGTTDTLKGGAGDDILYGGWSIDDTGADELYGESGKDKLYGGAGDDLLDGGDNNDELYGETGADTLYGGAGDDTLHGGVDGDKDRLEGGAGEDTYYAYHNDIIKDSDHNGKVFFHDKLLTGGEKKNKDHDFYTGDDGVYRLENGTLAFTKDGANSPLKATRRLKPP